MKTKGIRIADSKGNVLIVKLSDILVQISDGNNLNWSVLFLDGILNPSQNLTLTELKKKINHSENGMLIKWNDLIKLSDVFFQIYEVIILGSKDLTVLHRYKDEQEMHLRCDIVIELIDCAFWEIFSKNESLISKIKAKFKETELLDSN